MGRVIKQRLRGTGRRVPLNPVSDAAGFSQGGPGVLRNWGKLQQELFQTMVIFAEFGLFPVAQSQRFSLVLSPSLSHSLFL